MNLIMGSFYSKRREYLFAFICLNCHDKQNLQGINLAHLCTVCLFVGPAYL